MIGIQLEDGPRFERKVKLELSEHGLKVIVRQALGYPRGPLHLQFGFEINPQWTYVLRRQPKDPFRKKSERHSVDDEEGNMKSATRKMREAKSIEKSSDAGAPRTAAQGKGEQRGKNSTEARTTASGASRASRTTAGSLKRSVE
jgi:hypothetical protein